MIPTSLLLGALFAGELVIHSKVPVDVYVANTRAAQLMTPATWTTSYPQGHYELTLVIGGVPRPFEIDIPESGRVQLVVGTSGITVSEPTTPAEEPTGPIPVEVRCTSDAGVILVVEGSRHLLAPGEVLALELSPGRHEAVVLNAAGTVTWARGVLDIRNDELVIVQVAEGHIPEVSGSSTFRSSGQ